MINPGLHLQRLYFAPCGIAISATINVTDAALSIRKNPSKKYSAGCQSVNIKPTVDKNKPASDNTIIKPSTVNNVFINEGILLHYVCGRPIAGFIYFFVANLFKPAVNTDLESLKAIREDK